MAGVKTDAKRRAEMMGITFHENIQRLPAAYACQVVLDFAQWTKK